MFYPDCSSKDMKDDNASVVPLNRIISTLMSGHSSTRNEGQQFVLKSEPGFAARSNQVFENLKSLEAEHEKRKDEQVDPLHFQKADPVSDEIIDTSAVFKKPKGFAPKRKKPKEQNDLGKLTQSEKKYKCSSSDVTVNSGRVYVLGAVPSSEGSRKETAGKTEDSIPRKTVFQILGNNNPPSAASGVPGSSNSRQHSPVIVPLKHGETLTEARKKKKTVFYTYDTVKKSRLMPNTLVADTYVPKRLRPTTLLSPEITSRITVQKRVTSSKKRQTTKMIPHYSASTSSAVSRSQLGSSHINIEQKATIVKKIHVHPHSSTEKDME